VGSCGGEDGGSSHNNGGDEGRAIVRVQYSDARRGVVEGSELEMTRELRRVRVYRGWDAISETLKDKVLCFCDESLQVAGDRAHGPCISSDISTGYRSSLAVFRQAYPFSIHHVVSQYGAYVCHSHVHASICSA
jgi:hypothetical protein